MYRGPSSRPYSPYSEGPEGTFSQGVSVKLLEEFLFKEYYCIGEGPEGIYLQGVSVSLDIIRSQWDLEDGHYVLFSSNFRRLWLAQIRTEEM
jgi:hypothetical protein